MSLDQLLNSPSADAAGPIVSVPANDAEAVEAAREFAESIRPTSVARDASRAVPRDELDELRRSGLLGITVPHEYGGPEVSRSTVIAVFRTIATADAAIGQTPQAHFGAIEAIRLRGTDDQKRFFFSAALRGERIANAAAERGTARADIRETTLSTAPAGTLRLRGIKYYSTGALTADWIAVLAKDELRKPVLVLVPGDAPGIERHNDWNGFGQRSSNSGTTVLDDVLVRPEQVVPRPAPGDPPDVAIATTQLVHAAVDVGIARGAFEDGVAFIQTSARPWHEAGVEKAADEPHVILQVGHLATRLAAAEALLTSAAQTLDEVRGGTITVDSAARATLAVAQAKAFGAEVSLQIATEILEVAGSSATDASLGLDRHWRNARTHTLHDPARWKLHQVGAFVLSGQLPPMQLP
jgi:SfnB family sulfur acquisition oxidoreductase